MSFVLPLAFLALIAVPALLAIYWLRTRHRPNIVSSLMLWLDQRQTKQGGLLIDKLQTPLLLFLELLSILLLVAAAAGPLVRAGHAAKPLIVVLDDSYSMLAGGDESPRALAVEFLKEQLTSAEYASARLVLAGQSAQLLGEVAGDRQQLSSMLNDWKCFSPVANLDEAVGFAFAIGGRRAHILVITDHAPTNSDLGTVDWRAFGRSRQNFAFINATRTAHDDKDRCMLEIANLSGHSARVSLQIETGVNDSSMSTEQDKSDIELRAGGTQRITLELKAAAGPLRARIDDDALGIDNEVLLLPARKRPVRVELRIANDTLKVLVEKAASAAGALIVQSGSDLLLTDSPSEETNSGSWIMRINADEDAQSYLGPFVLDRAHPLSEGLSLDGVVWGAGKGAASGSPVITAGNVPLISDFERPNGDHEIKMGFRQDLSTLQLTPQWPVLIANVIEWRASALPGLREKNVHLGSDAHIALAMQPSLQITRPDGETLSLNSQSRTATVKAERPGLYSVAFGAEHHEFAVNALQKEESDLTAATSGHWAGADTVIETASDRLRVAWIFLLVAMSLLAVHLALISRKSRISFT